MAKQRVNILSQSAIDLLRRDHERLRMQVQMLEQRVRALSAGQVEPTKQLCQFRVSATFSPSDENVEGIMEEQFGHGRHYRIESSATERSITLRNLPAEDHVTDYCFYGDYGDKGLAYHISGSDWQIVNMQNSVLYGEQG